MDNREMAQAISYFKRVKEEAEARTHQIRTELSLVQARVEEMKLRRSQRLTEAWRLASFSENVRESRALSVFEKSYLKDCLALGQKEVKTAPAAHFLPASTFKKRQSSHLERSLADVEMSSFSEQKVSHPRVAFSVQESSEVLAHKENSHMQFTVSQSSSRESEESSFRAPSDTQYMLSLLKSSKNHIRPRPAANCKLSFSETSQQRPSESKSSSSSFCFESFCTNIDVR